MKEHIKDFKKLNIRVSDIPENKRIDVFIGTLKDNIKHEIRLWELDSSEKATRLARKIESEIMETRNPTTHDYNYGSFFSPSLSKFTPQQFGRKRRKMALLQL